MYCESAYEAKRMQNKSTVVNNIDQIYKFKNLGSFGKFILIIYIKKEIYILKFVLNIYYASKLNILINHLTCE